MGTELTQGQLGTKKGTEGEEFVNELAKKTFLHDWCFINPKLSDGKELCDLLIIFGDLAIVWQIKNTKLGDNLQMKESDKEKNMRQLTGAKRKLKGLKSPITLKNGRGESIEIDVTIIKEIFLISAFVGDEQMILEPSTHYKGEHIRNFTRGFIEIMLKELDTTRDFIEYLKKSNTYLLSEKRIIAMGGEEELLGWYIQHDRSFGEEYENEGLRIFSDDIWDGVSKNEQFIQKKNDDKVSYFWDNLITLASEMNVEDYLPITQEMAKLNRFDRRCISMAFWAAFEKANSQTNLRHFRRVMCIGGTTYCFLFQNYNPKKQSIEEFRKEREAQLGLLMYCTRGKISENHRVIGIATECGNGGLHSFDFGMVYIKDWTDEDEKERIQIQKETGIFGNIEHTNFHEDEYKSIK